MTELELRQKVVDTAVAWYGRKESNGSHKEIIDVYNSHTPLARSYKVKYTDAWCATFVSAVSIKCGLTDIMPTECGCPAMIKLYQALGTWVEDDAYVPSAGDVILYDWDDNGAGDNKGNPDHVGIVIEVKDKTMKIIEGNINNAVGYRTLKNNAKYIRGFGCPNYASKATEEQPKVEKEPEPVVEQPKEEPMIPCVNGIDISHHQGKIDTRQLDCDFVIAKATEGHYFIDPNVDRNFERAKEAGQAIGLYHFAAGNTSGVKEANYFVKKIKPYIGQAILALDWESSAVSKGTKYAKAFLDEVYRLTGVRAIIYMSKSVCNRYNWSEVAKDYPLWVAQYKDYNRVDGYLDEKDIHQTPTPFGAWGKPIIRQYSSVGYLKGFNSRLDFNKCYITRKEWDAMAQGKNVTPTVAKKTDEDIAKEVIAGKWGNGTDRRDKLTEAGYDFMAIQSIVDRILTTPQLKSITEVAKEVIVGKWGNGAERARRLTEAGYNANEVQKEVNKLMK